MIQIILTSEFFQLVAILFGIGVCFAAVGGFVVFLMALDKYIEQRRNSQ